jgi:hypothetical protein
VARTPHGAGSRRGWPPRQRARSPLRAPAWLFGRAARRRSTCPGSSSSAGGDLGRVVRRVHPQEHELLLEGVARVEQQRGGGAGARGRAAPRADRGRRAGAGVGPVVHRRLARAAAGAGSGARATRVRCGTRSPCRLRSPDGEDRRARPVNSARKASWTASSAYSSGSERRAKLTSAPPWRSTSVLEGLGVAVHEALEQGAVGGGRLGRRGRTPAGASPRGGASATRGRARALVGAGAGRGTLEGERPEVVVEGGSRLDPRVPTTARASRAPARWHAPRAPCGPIGAPGGRSRTLPHGGWLGRA